MVYTTEQIRNIAISGHGSTGKTLLTEQLLCHGNAIPKGETIESGRTVSDYTQEEINRKISIYTSLSHINYKDVKINILDTPGSSDFIGEVIAAFRAAESVLLAVSGDSGVQIETVKLWRRLNQMNKPRFIFINKMDKEHSEFEKCYNDIKEKFKTTIVPVTIPIGEGAGLKGIVDLIEEKAYMVGAPDKPVEIPADMADMVAEYRAVLIESAAEGEDSLMDRFLENDTLTKEEIIKGILCGLMSNKLVPVLCGSSANKAGISLLLDFIAKTCPAPYGEVKATSIDGTKEIIKKYDAKGDISCFVFKTSIDQFSGKLSFIKVISGKIAHDIDLIPARHDNKRERVTKIYSCLGKKLVDTAELAAGDIGVLVKLPDAETNDTLLTGPTIVYPHLELPQPVHAVAIACTNKKDEDKMSQVLHRHASEDLTFKLSFNAETKETVVSCMGELQLNIVLDKIKDTYKMEIETKVPEVAYRETITGTANAEYTHKKQSGGHGQYGKVVFDVKPAARGEQFKFINAIFGGVVSKGFMPGIEKGIIEAMDHGCLAGYPVVDVEVSIVDGKEHAVDSSEMAFKIAARGCFRAAMEKAKPVLLEPVMNLAVFVDEQYLGDVLSDLNSRRGRVSGQEPIGGGIMEVKAQVPQAELLRYSIDLRAITSGTASFEVSFDHYSPISGKVAEDVIKNTKHKKEVEE